MNLITDINFKNKIALIRVDYNVPLNSNLEVSDNTRIKNSLKTINYILNNEGSCILMSHLGRPKGEGYEKKFSFENFSESQKFVNEVGDIAEKEAHHPDIIFGWGYAKIQIFTHKIKGLVESDFILAAKIDKIKF